MKLARGTRLTRRQFTALSAAGVATAALPFGGQALAQTHGGTLTAVFNMEPPHINPGLGTSNVIQTAGGKVFQGLFNLDQDLNVIPTLAERIEVSDDGTEYTFHLRKDVRWHDGEPFTADDVIFSFEVVPQFHSRTRIALDRIEETVRVDDHTVRLRLTGPYLPFFLATSGVNMAIMPRHIYEGTDYMTNPANVAPIGTGPFRFSEWRRGEYIHLVRNEDYHIDDLPYVDQVFFPIVPDGSQRSISVETGQTNVIVAGAVNLQDQNRFVEAGRFRIIEGAYRAIGATILININLRNPPFDDVRFRKALMHAINRQQIVDNVFFGTAKIMEGPISSGTAYHDEAALTKYDFDPQKAIALMDEIGLVPDSNGVRATFRLIVGQNSANAMRTQELVRLHLGAVGLNATLVAVDSMPTRDAQWDFDLIMMIPGQFLDPDIGVSRFYLASNIVNNFQANTGGYDNPRVDELWAAATAATTVEEAQRYYSEIQGILSEDVPRLWLAEIDQQMLVRNDLQGFGNSPQEGYAEWDAVHFTS